MIYLTKHSNLSEGLYWAREITGEQDAGRGPWVIICVVGAAPFLDAYVVAYPEKSDDGSELGWRSSGRSARYDGRFNANCWEFGPRIEIPSDKDRVEYAPEQLKNLAKERVFA